MNSKGPRRLPAKRKKTFISTIVLEAGTVEALNEKIQLAAIDGYAPSSTVNSHFGEFFSSHSILAQKRVRK